MTEVISAVQSAGLKIGEPSPVDDVERIQKNIDFLDEVIRTLEGYQAFNERFIRKMGGEVA